MGGLGIAEVVSGIAKPFAELIDNLFTSDDERAQARIALLSMQVDMGSKLLEYEKERMALQSQIIQAEAKSGSWITRSWRPITMLTFLGMVVLFWFGQTPPNVEPYLPELFGLIKIGLGGYVIGRSAEKVVPQVAAMFKKDA